MQANQALSILMARTPAVKGLTTPRMHGNNEEALCLSSRVPAGSKLKEEWEVKALACIFATLICLATAPSSAAPPPDAAFITMEGTGIAIEAVHDVIGMAAEVGGHAYHVMPVHAGPTRELSGCCLIASVPFGHEPLVLTMPFVAGLYRPGEPISILPPGEEAQYAAGAWNYLLDEVIEPPPPGAEPFPNDALVSPEGGEKSGSEGKTAEGRAPITAPGQTQTSEFMIGKVAIGVVLPESNGSGENWSNFDPLYPGQNRRQLVYNKIVAGANWWATQAPASASLTFFYDQRLGIATIYEPITISSANNGETQWVADTLASMGYSTGDAFNRARAYDNAMRIGYGTDWAFSVFVADSLKDADDMFPNFTSAFAYLYGPYMVMTYDNGTAAGPWRLLRMNQVFAHETGHIFGAPDEYQAPTCTCSNYGYLGVTNGNCVYCTGSQATCVMVSNALALCTFTPGHVGWRDSDGDTILDPVDGGLALAAYLDYGATPPFSSNSQITGHGTAQASPWPSPTRTPVSINKVQVRYNVDAGPFTMATPRDGAFNSDIESFDFTTAAQANGPHLVAMMATDNWGSTAAVALNIVIDTTPPPMPPPMAMIVEAPYSSNPTIATVNWAPCPGDPESGIVGHNVVLRRPGLIAPVASAYVPMPQLTWPFTGLALQHGVSYTAYVAGVNGAGLAGPNAVTATLTIDLTPPVPPAWINDGGAGTNQLDRLTFNWAAATEDITTIADYLLDIRDDLGSPVWSGWTGSSTTAYTAMGLSLMLGTKYVGMVAAKNSVGLVGPLSGPSDGIMAVTFYPSIGQAKLTAGLGAAVGVNNLYVTTWGSHQPGVIYVQERNRSAGIRTDCTDVPSIWLPLNPVFQAAGILQLNTKQELYLSNSEVSATGSWKWATPLGMTGRSLGGGPMGAQPGVTGGSGANNVGLYVQIWGKVTFSNGPFGPPYYFVVDDGSGATDASGNKGVRVRSGSVSPPAQGAFVKVRGVCSYENGYPVVLIRGTGDWW